MPRAANPPSTARIERFRSRLRASRDGLNDAIAGLDEEGFRTRPAPDEWSVAEALAHLLDQEQLLNDRIALALERSGGELMPRAEEAHGEGAALGRRAPVPQLVHGLLAERRRSELLLDRMGAADLDRHVYHPTRREKISVESMLDKLVEHGEEHVAQVRELRARLPARPTGRAGDPASLPAQAMVQVEGGDS